MAWEHAWQPFVNGLIGAVIVWYVDTLVRRRAKVRKQMNDAAKIIQPGSALDIATKAALAAAAGWMGARAEGVLGDRSYLDRAVHACITNRVTVDLVFELERDIAAAFKRVGVSGPPNLFTFLHQRPFVVPERIFFDIYGSCPWCHVRRIWSDEGRCPKCGQKGKIPVSDT